MAPRKCSPALSPLPPPSPFDGVGRDEAVLSLLPSVRYHASTLKQRLPPHVELDDLVGAGTVGLLDAVDRFDPSRGIRFRTYAEFRIRGAMVDHLREMDWFPRSARQRATRLQERYGSLEAELGRPPGEEEVAESLGIDVEGLRRELSLAAGLTVFSLDAPPDDEADRKVRRALAEAALEESKEREELRELKERLGKAVDRLPERERKVVALYYHEELTMKEIGKLLAVGEPRVCQLHSQAVLRLRAALRREEEE